MRVIGHGELFEQLCVEYAGVDDVTVPDGSSRGFGAKAIKINGAVFVMLIQGQLAVKVPAARVRELVDRGQGEPLSAGKTTPMREWVRLTGGEDDVRPVIAEAEHFVAAQ